MQDRDHARGAGEELARGRVVAGQDARLRLERDAHAQHRWRQLQLLADAARAHRFEQRGVAFAARQRDPPAQPREPRHGGEVGRVGHLLDRRQGALDRCEVARRQGAVDLGRPEPRDHFGVAAAIGQGLQLLQRLAVVRQVLAVAWSCVPT